MYRRIADLPASDLSRREFVFSFALVCSLFFTCEFRVSLARLSPPSHSSLTAGGFAYGVSVVAPARAVPREVFPASPLITCFPTQLVDVLNAHFQSIFHISKTRSTLLQFAYFGAYLFFAQIAGAFVGPLLGVCSLHY
jgi:hypothetical protein